MTPGAAVVVFLIERSQRHHRRFAGHAAGIAEVIAIENVIADDEHALIAEVMHDRLEIQRRQIESFAEPRDLLAAHRVGQIASSRSARWRSRRRRRWRRRRARRAA